jgi:hypothetical protein
MDFPIWFSIAAVIFLGFVAFGCGRFAYNLYRRQQSGEIQPGDDWDPFQ